MAQQLNGWGRATGWGSLTFGDSSVPVATTGLAGTSALGSVISTGAALVGVSGNAATSALGTETATGTAVVALTGLAGTSALGTEGLITNNVLPITLGAATSSLGSISTSAAANVYPTSVLGTTGITSLLIWTNVLPGVTDNFNPIVTGQSTNWQEVA